MWRVEHRPKDFKPMVGSGEAHAKMFYPKPKKKTRTGWPDPATEPDLNYPIVMGKARAKKSNPMVGSGLARAKIFDPENRKNLTQT